MNITQMLEQKADELERRVKVLDKALEMALAGGRVASMESEAVQQMKGVYIAQAELLLLAGETLQVTR